MFHNNQGISHIPEMKKKIKQSGMIGWMKSDAGFVEDIKNPGQSPADLSRKAGPAGFTTRQGIHFAVERQVTEAQFFKNPQPMNHSLAEWFKGMRGGARRGWKFCQPIQGFGDRKGAERSNVQTGSRGSSQHD